MRSLHLLVVGLIVFLIYPTFAAKDNKETYYLKGNTLYNQGKYDEAEESYMRALTIDKNYLDAQRAMCKTISALQDCDSMPSCYKKLFELDPATRDEVIIGLENPCCFRQTQGSDKYESELYDTVIIILDESLDRNRNDTFAWNDKGIALGDLNRLEESIACFDEAIMINNNFAEAWNNKGVSLDKMNKHQEALENYNKSIDIDPKLAEAWYNKGKTLSLSDAAFEEARKCYLKSTEIDPMLKSNGEMLNWIYKRA
jgi:tetratricopeptide (TPR) repeat protein